jgi:DNA adenine methylase
MKKIFKWPGGKTKELKRIKSLLPDILNNVIEPFAGSAALSFDLEKKSIINDNDDHIMNLYYVIQDANKYKQLKNDCDLATKFNKNQLEDHYYICRDKINTRDFSNDIEMAYSFLVVRQLCFSGMFRINSKAEFNVPFGHYKSLKFNLNDYHHEFLNQKVFLFKDDFENIIKLARKDDFIFVDPPYLQRADYDITSKFTINDHQRLFNLLSNTNAKWLLIHCEDPFYKQMYKNFNILSGDFQYSLNFKGRSNENQKVNHLYITNY